MDNIFKQVIESEYRAKRIIDEAENERKQAEQNLEKEILRVREEIFLSARQRADEVKALKMEQAAAQVNDIMSETQEKIALMQKRLEENRSTWVRKLVEHVLNGNG